jgi:peptidoglycan/LPS O-acetylase OafA/YrhL
MGQSLVSNERIIEFDWLKIIALFLIVFVHSDLFFVFPEIIFPTEWFLVSCFFFVSGFLAYNSLHKRGSSIRKFLKSKILSLYIPFVAASIFYSVLQSVIGMMQLNIIQLLSQITLFNIFDVLNSAYNWDFLWFIPYLIIFMIIFCFIEKYVPNSKWQVLLVSSLWLLTIFLWVVDFSLKLGQVFSQYFLVFIVGFWLNKFSMYQKVTRLRIGLVMIPLVALFTIDLSNFFNFNTATEALKYLLYSNGRSIIFSLSAVLLVLIILRKLNIPNNRFVKWVATISILIYFMDPLFNYLISNYVFRQPIIYFSAGLDFWIYILFRIVALFVIFPFTLKAINKLFIRIRP